jgi:hypothetical protein
MRVGGLEVIPQLFQGDNPANYKKIRMPNRNVPTINSTIILSEQIPNFAVVGM